MIDKIKAAAARAAELAKDIHRFFFRSVPVMSNSRLNMYSTCPLKYRIYYEDGIKGFPSPPLHFGSAVHKALKEFHARNDLQGKIGELDELIDIYNGMWDKTKQEMLESSSGPGYHRWKVALAEAGCTEEEIEDTRRRLTTIYPDAESEENSKKGGIVMLENYFTDNQTSPNRIIAVEKALTVTRKGLDILAIIDRIEKTPTGEIEVVDYKTGKRVKDEMTIMLGGDTQAIIYNMMAESKWGRKLKNFYYYYLSTRTKVLCNPQRRLIEDTFRRLYDVAQNIKYQKYEASPGPLCGWCDYEVICPEWKGIRAPFKGIFRAARERGRMTFSYSKMSCYKNCPYNYRKLYVEKISPKPKHFFAIGHTCHETFEEFYSYPYQSSLSQLRKMYENHWHSEGYRDDKEEKEFFEEGWQWCSKYWKKYIDGQYVPAYAIELYFQLPIGNDYVVIGYVDRLEKEPDGTYKILDYKTDPKLRTQEEVDKDMQLTFYYWAMGQLGIEVKELSLEFLKFTQRVTTTRTQKDIPAFIDEVNSIVGEMAAREEELKRNPGKKDELFPPKINKYCGGCDFLSGCPKEHEIRTEYREQVMNLEEEEPDPEEQPEREMKDEEKSEGR